ncbi:MAG: polysaccharide export protein [Cyanothece sp. SIO1E1]|nr:polysaccharide export protein [Cyanothece sp. SIO1E1]
MLNLHHSRPLYSVMSAAMAVLVNTTLLPPTLAQSTATSAETVAHPNYILGVGDEVSITVFGYDEYNGSKVIVPNGTITLPVIGPFRAAGHTPESLAQALKLRLDEILVEPVVTVNLTTLRPVVINIAGEVRRPGPVQLRSLTTTNASNSNGPRAALEAAPTVSSAIMEAGGVTGSANIREVVLRRSLPGGESTTMTVNLWDSIWSEQAPEDLILQAGDSIFVPRLAADDTGDRRLLARSSLAPRTVSVRVIGKVNTPGEVQVSPAASISEAVAIAGGPTDNASLNAVQFVRLQEDGGIESQQIDLGNLTEAYQVQEGDVIVVPEKNTSSILKFMGRVLRPVGALLNVFSRINGF